MPATTAPANPTGPVPLPPTTLMPTSRCQYLRLIWSVAVGEFLLTPMQFRVLQFFGKLNGWHLPPKKAEEPEELVAARAELLRTLATMQPADAPRQGNGHGQVPAAAPAQGAKPPPPGQNPNGAKPAPPPAHAPHAAGSPSAHANTSGTPAQVGKPATQYPARPTPPPRKF